MDPEFAFIEDNIRENLFIITYYGISFTSWEEKLTYSYCSKGRNFLFWFHVLNLKLFLLLENWTRGVHAPFLCL